MLRSFDAIHLASALRLESDVVVSYDIRQIVAAEALGQRVESPGRPVGDGTAATG